MFDNYYHYHDLVFIRDGAVKKEREIFNMIQNFLVPVVLVLIVILPGFAAAEQEGEKTVQQKQLERYAKESLIRLKYAIKTDGFYNARVALNVWRSNAIDAGTYDATEYKSFKEQIYKKSINENLRWFEIFLNQKHYSDARICLELWRLHSEEIGVFDEAKYEELKKKLK